MWLRDTGRRKIRPIDQCRSRAKGVLKNTAHIQGVDYSPKSIAQELERRGHDVRWSMDTSSFGRGQIIWRTTDGILAGGTESRADGHIAMW